MTSVATLVLERFVTKLTLRSPLTLTEQEAIRTLPTKRRECDANEDFVFVGDIADHACFILEGLVGRFGQVAEGGRQISAL